MTGGEVRGRGTACARAALAGNPSVVANENCTIEPPSEAVEATVRRFARLLAPDAATAALRWRTSVPRGVGLGGSSAIVISTLRALCELQGVTLAPDGLAS